MSILPTRAALSAVVLGALALSSCSDPSGPITGVAVAGTSQLASLSARGADVRAAIAAQERHTPALKQRHGVIGTGVGLDANGQAVVHVFVLDNGVAGIPAFVDNVPVQVRVTGRIMALSNPTLRARPAPVGYSVGHPAITAGTIGARATNGTNVFILSNNHVLAASNDASIGDVEMQPGAFDGGTNPADVIATLTAFKPLNFSGGNNTMDAAIAMSNTNDLDNSTPTDDGYGRPNSQIFDDANSDRVFDDKTHLLGLQVAKYGRTTKLTHATITSINASLDVCYEVVFIFCVKSAHFVDQVVIASSSFSGGGDSGSLIVTDDANHNPVALLFAGSSTETIGNRIDLVLNYFNVNVDGTEPGPPTPLTDAAVMSVTAPSSVSQGAWVPVSVVVRNVGNQPVGAFDVSLQDQTASVDIGTQSVAGLAAGASATLSFTWNTTGGAFGSHLLVARHTLVDENAANDHATKTVVILDPSNVNHVGDLDGAAQSNGSSWSATVEVTVHDANHLPINGATVTGVWNPSGLASDECTTGELGGTGTCIFLFPGLRKGTKSVTFTVNNVVMSGRTYTPSQNHDPDGSSNGTAQKVLRP